jgi:pimeloyl-ACP methyl ester carboxylesterase
MGEFHFHTIDSAIQGRKRKIRVWLPAVYTHHPSLRCRLLIQHDAQMAFTERDEELPYGSWGIDEWLGRLIPAGVVEPVVVVAVDNSPKRMREYFPVTEEFALYQRFLLEELLPWVRGAFRVSADPAQTATMGSSMGGLVSFALALNHPEIFGAAACLSPWFENENNRYIHDVLRKQQEKPPIRVYMDSGIRDARGLDDGHRGVLLARLELLRLGFVEGQDLDWFVDTRFATEAELHGSKVKPAKLIATLTDQHNEFHWNRRLERPLRFLFGRTG